MRTVLGSLMIAHARSRSQAGSCRTQPDRQGIAHVQTQQDQAVHVIGAPAQTSHGLQVVRERHP